MWDLWQAGDEDGAREAFDRRLAPLIRLSTTGLGLGHTVHKEILRHRGVVKSAHVRAPSDPLDGVTARELAETCERLGIG